MNSNPRHPSPDSLKECRRGAEWAAVAAAASDAGLFDALAQGAGEDEQLARRLDLDRRALAIVLEALAALDLVERENGVTRLSAEGRARFVDRDSGSYEAVACRRWRSNMRRWLRLDEALRNGGPLSDDDDDEGGGDGSLFDFMAAMAAKPADQVQRVVEGCLRRRPGAQTVLDLGGGPGVHSRAFVERGLQATLFDTPEVIEHVRSAYSLDAVDAIELIGGDFLESLPDGRYDIVLLSNITHIYDADTNAALLARAGRLQIRGDLIAILDFVRGRSPFAPLFAITMLLATESGNTYGVDLYGDWLEAANYESIEIEDIDDERQLVTALKR